MNSENPFDMSAMMTAPGPEDAEEDLPLQHPKVVENPVIHYEIIPAHGTDIRPLALSLVPYQEIVADLVKKAKAIQVTDDKGRKAATELGLLAKKTRLKIEATKKLEAYLEAEQFIKQYRNLVNTLSDPLKGDVEQVCRDKLTEYSKRLLQEKQRKEAEAREEARKLQAELDAEAQRMRDEALAKAKAAQEELDRQAEVGALDEANRIALEQTVADETEAAAEIVAPTAVVQVEDTKDTVRTAEGSSFTRTRWKARLVDVLLVNRKYLDVNLQRVQKDVDSGLRAIPGFEVYEDISTSFRG